MPVFKPAYLIHGDDHGRIAERRARLREMAESESGAAGVELLEGDAATPENAAAALAAMTFALGRRFVIVDGVERWKEDEVKRHLVPVLKDPPPETTAAFFAREEGRAKVPPILAKVVEKAGGDVAAEKVRRGRELPRWLRGEAAKLGVQLDDTGARALVAQVGERQQRLLRELEKLAIDYGPGATLTAEEVEAAAAHSSERQVWGLVDALVGRDAAAATRAYLQLRAQGEALDRLAPLAVRRLREVLAIAVRLQAGETPAQVKGVLRMSPYAADRRIAEARDSDVDTLRRAVEELADLEATRRSSPRLDDDTLGVAAIARVTRSVAAGRRLPLPGAAPDHRGGR
ncbi:MAG TPA: DNA polymerase III subunit delta [Solirubrobacteraceae bacterium]|nr:DNA polymerase III subunit delta [Solirubrobacteraceae bacterium]